MKYFLTVIKGVCCVSLWGLHGSTSLWAEGITAESAIKEAWQAYQLGEFEKAREGFRKAEGLEVDNAEAKYGLTKVAEHFERMGALDHGKMRMEMLEGVSRGWQSPRPEEKLVHVSIKQEGLNLPEALKRIHVDKLSFSEAPLSRVVEHMGELAAAEGVKASFIVSVTEGKDPKLTLTLRELTLERALQHVATAAGFQLEYSQDAVVLRLAEGPGGEPLETAFFPLSRAAVVRLTGMDNRFEKTGPGTPLESTRLVQPSTLEEEVALRGFFQRAGIPFDIPRCTLAFDGSELFVTHTPRQLERLRRLLERYEKTYQVEIEAKFMEVQQGALEELGFQWRLSHGKSFAQTLDATGRETTLRSMNDAFTRQTPMTGNGSILQPPPAGAVPIPNLMPAFPGNINVGGMAPNLANVLGVFGEWNIDMVVRALEQQTGADLMSAPKLTVLSGKTAEIVVAREFRYPEAYGKIDSAVGMASSLGGGGSAGVTITAGTPQDFVTRRVGVQMEVTPTVEEDGKWISLRLEPRVTEFEGFVEYGGRSIAISGGTTVDVPSGFFQPIFSLRQIRTEVTIANGATVIMGGLAREEQKTVNDKVPILGDIPLLGQLFRSKGETTQKKSLLILVSGNVISPGGMPSRLEADQALRAPEMMTPVGMQAVRGVGES